MKFWISKNTEVSVREQIVTQIRLGVATHDLRPGEKLPSTRELARRFGIHANTVSAAYRELAADEVVELRKGSGVFVTTAIPTQAAQKSIDQLLADFVAVASASGFTRSDLESALDRWRNANNVDRKLILVESDLGLREIVREEIRIHLGVDPLTITLEEYLCGSYDRTAVITALYDEKVKIQPSLDPGQSAIFIQANSVPHTLTGSQRPENANLIAVVSGWKQFIVFARIYLLAARIDPEALIIRSTSDPEWRSGLDAAAMIICDSYAAKELAPDSRLKIFRLINDDSIAQLRHALI